jgi:hypothetical protein
MRFREFLESYDKLGTGIKKGHTLEARGTKGPDKKEWAKSFKDKAELDAWVKDNDAKVFGIAYAEKVTESVGQTPWEIICDIVEKDHGEENLVDLAIAEAGRILDLGKADELAGKEFFDLPVGKMKALVNAHPELLKGKAASRYKKQLTEDTGTISFAQFSAALKKVISDAAKADGTIDDSKDYASAAWKIYNLETLKNAVSKFTSLLKKDGVTQSSILKIVGKANELFAEKVNEAAPDKAGKGHKIEAYGVKGMNSTRWRKTFKDEAALEKWVDANDAEVHGTREL